MTQEEKFADNRRRAAIANKKYERCRRALDSYLNRAAKVKRLRKAEADALDEINVLVLEWNDIVMGIK
jgi:hypothetical protein